HLRGARPPRTDISAPPSLARRPQRSVRAYKGSGADLGAMLGDAVVIAGDGARADIGARTDAGVADIGEVIDLGTFGELRLFDLDEIADLGVRAKLRAWPQSGVGTDFRVRPNMRIDEVAETMNGRAVLDDHAGAEKHVRLDDHVPADFGVMAEKHRLRRDERRPFGHDLVAQPGLHGGFGLGKLDARIHAEHFV